MNCLTILGWEACMQLSEIVRLIDGEVFVGADLLEQNIQYGFSSDMMSDVLAYVEGETMLLTGLNNAQVIRTAEMLDVKVITLVRGKTPCQEVVDLASANDIVIISTKHTLFAASGILYKNGLSAVNV